MASDNLKENPMHSCFLRTLLTRTVTACFVLLFACAAIGRDFYVAPYGADNNPGTVEKPFATIARARDAVRPMVAAMSGDITVWIRGGRYHLNEAIALDDRDSGKGKHRVIYRNYKDEKVTILGGVPVTGWTPYERGIMKANVGKDVEFWALLVDDKLATMAQERRWRTKPKSLRNIREYGQMQWMSEYRRIVSVDPETGKPKTEFPRAHYGGSAQYMEGHYTFVNQPGEWAMDSDSGTLYYYPKSPDELNNVVRATTRSIFQIRGRSDSQQVRNITIEGLQLRLTDTPASVRCYANTIQTGGIEHHGADYPETIRTAQVLVENANNIQVRYCNLGEAPLNAVSIYMHATNNTVYGCRINNVGYNGVCIAGPWINNKAPNINYKNVVKSCYISNLTKGLNHPSGVYVYQSSDNLIQNNLIHTSSRYAISIKSLPYGMYRKVKLPSVSLDEWYKNHNFSNRNRVSRNYIYDCNKRSADGGAIETWGGGRDGVMDNNIIFNCYGGNPKKGWRAHHIFLDNASSFWTVGSNIAWCSRIPGGNAPQMVKERKNRIENNVYDTSNIRLGGLHAQDKHEHEFNRNIFYANSPLKMHPDGKVGPEKDGDRLMFIMGKPPASMISSMDNNLYYNALGKPLFSTGSAKGPMKVMSFDEWRAVEGGFDKNSRIADPQFVDASERDYRLRETSPALDMGITSIDTSAIGPLEDFPFAPANDALHTAFLKANGKDVYLEVQSGDSVKLQVAGRTKRWFVADLSEASISYETDNSKVATVSKDGKVVLTGKGRVCLTATVTLNGVTRSDEVVIYVGMSRRASRESNR